MSEVASELLDTQLNIESVVQLTKDLDRIDIDESDSDEDSLAAGKEAKLTVQKHRESQQLLAANHAKAKRERNSSG